MDKKKLLEKEHWTRGEVAGYCEVTVRTVDNWISRGRLPAFRTPGGAGVRFKRDDVLKYFDSAFDSAGASGSEDSSMG